MKPAEMTDRERKEISETWICRKKSIIGILPTVRNLFIKLQGTLNYFLELGA